MDLFYNIPLPKKEENYIHYTRYKNFILSRPKRNLIKEKGFHIHHICPRSLGGKDENNLIKLTVREHFIAHMILFYCKYKKMISTFYFMIHNNSNFNITSKQYEILQEEYREILSKRFKGIPKSEEHKNKISKAHLGMSCSEEAKNKIALDVTGRVHMYNYDTKENIFSYKDKVNEYKEKGFIIGRTPELDYHGKNNPMYGKNIYDNKTLEERKIINDKKALNGNKNPMYGKNIYDSMSEERKIKMVKVKQKSMTETWKFKKEIIENNLKIHCITLNKYFSTLNEASIECYYNNRNVKSIILSIKNKTEIKGLSWELVKC